MRGMKGRKRITDETASAIKRTVIYVALMFLLAIARYSFFEQLVFLPVSPDLVLAAVSVIALTDRRETALISAVAGGIMTDAIGGAGVYLSPIAYFAAALIIGLFAKKMMARYLSWLVVLPIACAIGALLTVAEAYVGGGNAVFSQLLLRTVLPELLCSALLALPVYPLVRLCVLPFKGKRRGLSG